MVADRVRTARIGRRKQDLRIPASAVGWLRPVRVRGGQADPRLAAWCDGRGHGVPGAPAPRALRRAPAADGGDGNGFRTVIRDMIRRKIGPSTPPTTIPDSCISKILCTMHLWLL